MNTVHLLMPGSAARVRCGLDPGRVTRATRKSAVATCDRCCPALRPPRPPVWTLNQTNVDGDRRATLLCECGALMVAGIDHDCTPGSEPVTSVWSSGSRPAWVDSLADQRRAQNLAGPLRVTRAVRCAECDAWIRPGVDHVCTGPGEPLV